MLSSTTSLTSTNVDNQKLRQKMSSSLSGKKTPSEYIRAMKKMAESRGGKLVSSKWEGSSIAYEFVDATNHTFASDYTNVMRGRWSPHEGKISEPLCRQVLEHLFESEFPSTRSIILPEHNGTDYAWELDGYCEDKKIAFEYQGHPCHWNPEDPNYDKTSKRDAQKLIICERLGITLVQIPAFTKGNIWAKDRVYQHVLSSVEQTYANNNLSPPILNASPFEPDFTCLNKGIKQLEQLRQDAALYGLTVKEPNYPYPEYRFTMLDEHGVLMQRSHRSLQKRKRLDFLMLQSIAQEHGCLLLESDFKGGKTQHRLKTPHGEITISGDTIKNNFPSNIKTYIGKKHNARLQRLMQGGMSSATQSIQGLLDTMAFHGITPSPKSQELLNQLQTWVPPGKAVARTEIQMTEKLMATCEVGCARMQDLGVSYQL